MPGMGKPGDGQTWVYDTDTDRWIAGATGGGGLNVDSAVSSSAYYGYCTGSLLWSATTWTDFFSVPGNFTDVITNRGITRSGSTFSVNETGAYNVYVYFNQYGGSRHIGFRLSGSNGTLAQRTAFATDDGVCIFNPIVQLSSGSSFRLQYATKNGSAASWNTSDPLDGEAMRTGEIAIHLVKDPVVISQTIVGGALTSSWETTYDLDLATLVSQSFALTGSGPSPVILDGKTWYLENQTNAETFGILPGTGLVIDLNNNTSDYEGATRNLPLITSRIRSFVTGYNRLTDDVRFWVRLELTGATNAGNDAAWGFEKMPPYNNTQRDSFISLKGLNPSLSWYAKNRFGSSQEDMGALTTNASHDVVMLRQNGKRQIEFWTGAFNTAANTWPKEDELFLLSVSDRGGAAAFANNAFWLTSSLDAGILLGAQAGSTPTTNFKVTYKRIRLDIASENTASAGGGDSALDVNEDVATSASFVTATPTFENREFSVSIQTSGSIAVATTGSIIYSTSLGNYQMLDIEADIIGANVRGFRRSRMSQQFIRFEDADNTLSSDTTKTTTTKARGDFNEPLSKWTERFRFFKDGTVSRLYLEVTGSGIVDWSAKVRVNRQQTFETSLSSSASAPELWSEYVLGWYRSDDVVTNGSAVTQVNDRSGNGRHLGQGGSTSLAPTQETSVALFNNRPSFNFNGSTQFLTGTIWNLSAQSGIGYTIFAVFIPQAWGNDGIWDLSDNTNTNRYAHLMQESTIRVRYGGSAVMTWTDPTLNQPTYVTVAVATGSWERSEVWEKGVSKATSTTIPAFAKPNNIRIGSLFQDTYYFQAKYAELIICSGTLPVQGRQEIEAYLSSRYNIT